MSTSLADDMADVIEDAEVQGRRIVACFKLLARATGLDLNFEKCVCWVFNFEDVEKVKGIFERMGGGMELMKVGQLAKYQGLYLGQEKDWEYSWQSSMQEYLRRARDIRSFGLGVTRLCVL